MSDNRNLSDINNNKSKNEIKKERNSRIKIKSEASQSLNTQNNINNNESASELLRVFAKNKAVKKNNYNFNDIREDLKYIIKNKKLMILSGTYACKAQHSNDPNFLELIFRWSDKGKLNCVQLCSKMEDLNDLVQYPMFKKSFGLILSTVSKLNRIEINDLTKLQNIAVNILDKIIDFNDPVQLVKSNIFTKNHIAQQFIEKKDCQIDEYIFRLKNQENSSQIDLIKSDIEQLNNKNKLFIPICFKISNEKYKDKQHDILQFQKTKNNKTIHRKIGFNSNQLDKFRIYEIIMNIFNFLKDNLNVLEIQHLKNDINGVIKQIESFVDKDDFVEDSQINILECQNDED